MNQPKGKRTMESSKREFLKAGAGIAALAAMPRAMAQTPAGWQPSGRYPDPSVKEVGGGNRRGERVPQALEQRQRQYA